MAFARVTSAQPGFPTATLVDVECDFSKGLHSFTVVGLPDKAVEEARDRVNSAIKHSGFTPPKGHARKIVISLAPADLKKEGPLFDIAIALAYLLASEDIDFDPKGKLFLGELALDGSVRGIHGALTAAHAARKAGLSEIYVPHTNAREAAHIEGVTVYGITSLKELIEHLTETQTSPDQVDRLTPTPPPSVSYTPPKGTIDLSDIRGQETAKRGLLIAASGRHNLALFGPPGTGKTLLARAFTGILPALSFEEAIEATMIHSLAHSLSDDLIVHPPFRAPHHTASHISLVGGGATIRPGEVTLAHRGVLFLDEFPEFEKRSIESLRQPLEDRVVSVSRARGTVTFPANFILIAAMNPTPLGGAEDPRLISERERLKYQKKISGPIIDRIDMWIEVPAIDHELLAKPREKKESESRQVRELVTRARARQYERFQNTLATNSDLSVRDLEEHASLAPKAQHTLTQAAKTLSLSPRAYHRVIKLARTIADLDNADHILEEHILEALQYRPKTLFT